MKKLVAKNESDWVRKWQGEKLVSLSPKELEQEQHKKEQRDYEVISCISKREGKQTSTNEQTEEGAS